MAGFSDFKKKSKNSVASLTERLDKLTSKESYKDDRIWKPGIDKAGNGYAVIRFLPEIEGEDAPFVAVYSHAFKGKGGWLFENCPTTLGEKCPVCQANTELWNSGIEDDKNIARQRKRKLAYISNILVLEDPANPENKGKVFLYQYGTKIFQKIQSLAHPEYQDEVAVDPFNFWTGADFKIKIRNVGGYVNYDRSEFSAPAPLLGGDDKKLEELWKKQYSLKEFTDKSQFKSYDELQARLKKATGDDIRAQFTDKNVEDDVEDTVSSEEIEEKDPLKYFSEMEND
jgi:gp32 DNA binding protein like